MTILAPSSSVTECAWCGAKLPEPQHDAWLVTRDRIGQEKPACTACVRRYKPTIVRIEKEE